MADEQFKTAIAEQLAVLAEVEAKQILPMIEVPRDLKKGDFAVPVPKFNKIKKLTEKPNDLASRWAAQIKPNNLISKAEADGAFLNFTINKAIQTERILKEIFEKKEKYGTSNIGAGKNVVVEYSSPNIAKPFHAGHLRSTIIGNFIKHIYKALGYNVTAINYLGDWGKQYGLLAVAYERFGNEEALRNNPIRHLFDIYVAINKEADADPTIHDQARAYFKRMEDGDEQALSLWRKFRDLSIDEYKKIYSRLNVEFDVYSGESLQGEGMKKELTKLQESGLLQESNGAQVVDLEKFKFGKALVTKKDGTTLYITRDIAAASARADEYKFDKMFYVVAAQQNLHFQQLFKILDLMGYSWAKQCSHINFGMVKGMSTRKGTVVFLEDILDEAAFQMLTQMKKNEKKFSEIANPEEVSDIVGLSAVVIQDLGARRVKDYDFDWDRMTSSEGDTGPYLQYAHARLRSVERKAEQAGLVINSIEEVDLSLLVEEEAHKLATIAGKFHEVIVQASNTLEPCSIVTYLFELGHAISVAFDKLWVLGTGVERPLALARLLLFTCARLTLGSGLKFLGLKPLERM